MTGGLFAFAFAFVFAFAYCSQQGVFVACFLMAACRLAGCGVVGIAAAGQASGLCQAWVSDDAEAGLTAHAIIILVHYL